MAVIQFDVDGVLADFAAGFAPLLGLPPMSDLTAPGWSDDWGVDAQILSDAWDKVKRNEWFWYKLPPLYSPEDEESLAELSQDHDLYFVTNRPGKHAKWQTEMWLVDNGIIDPTVIISSRKAEIAQAINADYSLEDKAGNAVAIAYMAPNCTSYLVDRPYNRFDGKVLGSKVRRVATLGGFLDVVR